MAHYNVTLNNHTSVTADSRVQEGLLRFQGL